jgi:hypothetical protein
MTHATEARAETPQASGDPIAQIIALCEAIADELARAAGALSVTGRTAAHYVAKDQLGPLTPAGENPEALRTLDKIADAAGSRAQFAKELHAAALDQLETLRDQLSAAREEAPRMTLTLMAEPRTFDGFTGAAAVRRLMQRAEDQAGAEKRRRMMSGSNGFIPTIGDERIETLPTSTKADALTIAGLLIQEARAWRDAHCRP